MVVFIETTSKMSEGLTLLIHGNIQYNRNSLLITRASSLQRLKCTYLVMVVQNKASVIQLA